MLYQWQAIVYSHSHPWPHTDIEGSKGVHHQTFDPTIQIVDSTVVRCVHSKLCVHVCVCVFVGLGM